MTVPLKVPRRVAFGLMVLYAVLGTAFILGLTMMDPGGVPAVVLSVSWFVPMIVLAFYALRRPDSATGELTIVAALVAVFVVLDAVFAIVPSDEIGPLAVGVVATMLESGDGPPYAALGGSSTAVAVPVLIIGGLFLLAASAGPGPDDDARHGMGQVDRVGSAR